MSIEPYRCAYCFGPVCDPPISIEAICWRCWWEQRGRDQAVREWKAQHWWRRLIP